VPLPGCSFGGRSCEVGKGFYAQYRALAGRIKGSLSAIGCQKSSPLAVTGHSLGATLATLASFELSRSGYHVSKCYTFGQPRVGNAAFASAFNTAMASIPVYRLSRADDPIVYLPPPRPFHHVGREVWYAGESSAGYRICDGTGEDRRCSGRNVGPMQVAGLILACLDPNTCGHVNYLRPAMHSHLDGHMCRRRLSNSSEQAVAPTAQTLPNAGPSPAPVVFFP